MSGSVLASQSTRLSRRLLMLLMLKVTIFRVQASIYIYCDLNKCESGKPTISHETSVSEEATLKRRQVREGQIVDCVHEGCGRRGFGLCPHPAKCNPGEDCCVEAEPSPASVRESEAYRDDENRRTNGGELRNAAASQKLED